VSGRIRVWCWQNLLHVSVSTYAARCTICTHAGTEYTRMGPASHTPATGWLAPLLPPSPTLLKSAISFLLRSWNR
jgi:hypothetical protein